MGEKEDFAKFLKQLIGSLGILHVSGSGPGPTTNNPEKYPRHVLIEDDQALMLLAEMEHCASQIEQLVGKLQLYKQQGDLAKTKFFLRCEEAYPQTIVKGSQGGNGWRTWQGKTWLVSWDNPEEDDSDD